MPLTEIRERQARLRLLLSIVRRRSLTISYKRLLAALQDAVGGFLPALFILRSPSGRRRIVLTVYGLVPFIVSFHDLRLKKFTRHVKGDTKSTPPDIWQ